MKIPFAIVTMLFVSSIPLHAQEQNECSIMSGVTDTVECDNKKLIVDLSFCESNNLYQTGLVTDLNGKEEFCFFYRYDKKHQLKSITFWTFQWKNGGYSTNYKVAGLRIKRDRQKFNVKRKYDLDLDFVKMITKTN